jgi:iron complex outermembrane receptor protein
LSLTVGTKIEHNQVSGFELEPSIRLAWHPTERQTVWAAVSRSVHTPSVLERNIRYDAQIIRVSPLTIARQISEGNTQNEVQIAYELGYRFQPATAISLDAAVFYNELPTVQAFRQGSPFLESSPAPVHFVLPLELDKTGLRGKSCGLELAARWQAAERWRLFAEYSYLEVTLNTMPGLTSFSSYTPRHRFGVRSSLDLPGNWQWDLGVKYASARPGAGVASYLVGDFQLAWRPNTRWELSISGQNLGDSQHAEISPATLGRTVEISTTYTAKISWKY